MKYTLLAALGVIALAGALAGCGSDEPTFTKAQEDALRHPQKDPNWKPASPGDLQKEQSSIADFRQRHAHDQVGFTNAH